MSKKVFLFTDGLVYGGVEKVVLQLIEGLDRKLWEPVLVHYANAELAPLIRGIEQMGTRKIEIPEMPLGLKGASAAKFLYTILKLEKPSIFHAHLSWPLACKWAVTAAILARVPGLILTEHLYMDIPYSKMARIQQRLLSIGVKNYLADSRAIAENLSREFGIPGNKIQVIYNGVNVQDFQQVLYPRELKNLIREHGKPVILTVARLHPQKGLRYLIKAAEAIPEALFVIVGDGPERDALEQEVTALELNRRVFFLGYRGDTQNWLGASTAFVLPSLYEGFPIVLLEAMAAGKPVISTTIEGNDESVISGETGLLVPPKDPHALAGAIKKVLLDPVLARRMGESGRERVARDFPLKKMIDQVSRVYQESLRE